MTSCDARSTHCQLLQALLACLLLAFLEQVTSGLRQYGPLGDFAMQTQFIRVRGARDVADHTVRRNDYPGNYVRKPS